MALKNQVVSLLLTASLFFFCLDAYSIFEIPFSWIGLLGLFFIAISVDYKTVSNFNVFLIVLVLLIPTFLQIISLQPFQINLNVVLRIFNIVSFVVVLLFSLNYFNKSKLANFNYLLQKLLLILSVFAIYSYFAQIFDFPEFIRTRSNTGLLGSSSQTTFWKNEPHRMLGTFREPVLLASTLLPLYLLYIFSVSKLHKTTVILASLAIGLTRSDLVRIYCSFVLVVLIINYLMSKKVHNAIIPIVLVLIFSLTGLRECDLNPASKDCIESNVTSTEVETIIFSDIENTLDIGDDRSNVLSFAIYSFKELSPKGISNVNYEFSSYLSSEINNEMYLTSRTLPNYLLTRYASQNFGTGNYSLLRYYPNVQNLFINSSLSFGAPFIAFLFLIALHYWISSRKNLNFYLFLLIPLFFFLTPVEEFNSFTALVIGVGYNMIVSNEEAAI